MVKKPYTVVCTSALKKQAEKFCRKRKVNAADVARSVLFLVAPETIEAVEDPGLPVRGYREEHGGARRKPRLQLRLPAGGYSDAFLRKALALAVVESFSFKADARQSDDVVKLLDQNERLKASVGALAFEPLVRVVTRQDALYILGFPPGSVPTRREFANRYKMLATIFHPDNPDLGSHKRMSQINLAFEILSKG